MLIGSVILCGLFGVSCSRQKARGKGRYRYVCLVPKGRIFSPFASKLGMTLHSSLALRQFFLSRHEINRVRFWEVGWQTANQLKNKKVLSRFSRESPSFSSNLPVSRLEHQIFRELLTVALFTFLFH